MLGSDRLPPWAGRPVQQETFAVRREHLGFHIQVRRSHAGLGGQLDYLDAGN